MPKKLPTLASRFDRAVSATGEAREIAALQAEIDQLRKSQSPELEKQLATLRGQLEAQSGEHDIEVSSIDYNPAQPRRTISVSSIQTLARTLEKDGQITPIILIPQGDRYLLWDGQRRWEAAKFLEWRTIRAVIAPMPEDLHRKALLTFIHHEDLNPLDKAEAIVKEVASSSDIEEQSIPVLLSTVLRRLERQEQAQHLNGLVDKPFEKQQKVISQLGIHDNEEKLLLAFLELVLHPPSVRSNLMPMLSLPADLKQAIRDRGLKGAHALALSGLSAKNLKVTDRVATKERLEATEKVLDEELTVAKTREIVREIKSKFTKPKPSQSKAVKTTVQKLNKLNDTSLKEASREDLLKLKTALENKLSEIESILS